MKLVSAAASPFVRKVHVVLHETGQTGDVEIVPVKTSPLSTSAEVRAANPIGKIPALIRSDGPALYDSRVICQYLNERVDAHLYPDSRKWEVMTLEATADGIMDAAVLISYENRLRPSDLIFKDWTDAQWAKVTSAVSAVNDRWMSHLNGPLDIGQIAMGCALGYLDFRHDARGWRKGNDALDDWFAAFSRRDSMIATAPSD